MRASFNEIAELACDVRNGIEHGILSAKELTRPYVDLYPDRFQEAQNLRRKGLANFPRGWCQVTTAFIRYMLKEGEPLDGLLLGRPHCMSRRPLLILPVTKCTLISRRYMSARSECPGRLRCLRRPRLYPTLSVSLPSSLREIKRAGSWPALCFE